MTRIPTLFALCCALGSSVSVSLAAHAQEWSPPEATPDVIHPRPVEPSGRPRALWVLAEGSQRVLEHPDRLDELFVDVAALEITDLFVQVYRGGRSWFPSSRADSGPYERVFRTGAPGETPRDALQLLLDRAEAAGVRVHAWVNVLSLSKNRDAPIVRDLGRDVVLSDQQGRSLLDYPNFETPAPEGDYYRMGTPGIYLDPAFPGVGEYLSATFDELLTQYPALAGLHFDYIRYPDVLPFSPGLRFGVGISLGHGAASRTRFTRETGLVAPNGDSLGHGNRFDDWRREKLTELVAYVGNRARAARPGLEISAAVISYADRAYLSLFQDWRGWLEEGLIDVAVPMLYSKDPRIVRYGVEHFAGLPYAERIWVGLGTWLFADRPELALAQLGEVASRPPLGVALFSWDSIRQSDPLRTALARTAEPAPPPETEAHEFPIRSTSETVEPPIAPPEPAPSASPPSEAVETPVEPAIAEPALDPASLEPPAVDPAPGPSGVDPAPSEPPAAP